MTNLDDGSVANHDAGNNDRQSPGHARGTAVLAVPSRAGSPCHTAAARELADADLTEVREALRGLRYGVVEIIVQDGVIVQLNRTEKRRLAQHASRH